MNHFVNQVRRWFNVDVTFTCENLVEGAAQKNKQETCVPKLVIFICYFPHHSWSVLIREFVEEYDVFTEATLNSSRHEMCISLTGLMCPLCHSNILVLESEGWQLGRSQYLIDDRHYIMPLGSGTWVFVGYGRVCDEPRPILLTF